MNLGNSGKVICSTVSHRVLCERTTMHKIMCMVYTLLVFFVGVKGAAKRAVVLVDPLCPYMSGSVGDCSQHIIVLELTLTLTYMPWHVNHPITSSLHPTSCSSSDGCPQGSTATYKCSM